MYTVLLLLLLSICYAHPLRDEFAQREEELLERILKFRANPPSMDQNTKVLPGWAEVDAIAAALKACGPVAGFSFIVTKGDQVIHVGNQGYADIEKRTPVTPDTLFAIGSTTKAMTAAVMAMLEEDKLIQWTEPIRKLDPQFSCFEPEDSTLIDLLSMRAGYAPGDWMLFTNPTITPSGVITLLQNIPFAFQWRSLYSYSNWAYATGAYIGAHIAKTTWENLMTTRLFNPLSMKSTTPYLKTLDESPRAAKPYSVDGSGNFVLLPPGTDSIAQPIGPAGAVVSSINDMSLWLRFLMTGKNLTGFPVIDYARLARTWKPNVQLNKFVMYKPEFPVETATDTYCLGWGAGSYRERRVAVHAGSIDGYSSFVGFMPDEKIGFAWLTNTDPVVSGELIMMAAFDIALGYASPWLNTTTVCTFPCPWDSRCSGSETPSSSKPEHPIKPQHKTPRVKADDFAPYIGTYFSPFGNGTVSATQISFPAMPCFPTKHQGGDIWVVRCELGPSKAPISVPLQFVRDFKGVVVGMSMDGQSLGSRNIPNFNWVKAEYEPQIPFKPVYKPGIGTEL